MVASRDMGRTLSHSGEPPDVPGILDSPARSNRLTPRPGIGAKQSEGRRGRQQPDGDVVPLPNLGYWSGNA